MGTAVRSAYSTAADTDPSSAEAAEETAGDAAGPHRQAPGADRRNWLGAPMPPNGTWGWLGPILVALAGGVLRFYRLSEPKSKIFDEVYYARNALSLLRHGVEIDKGAPEFIAHPPLGKWAIAGGEAIFGDNSLGWRFSAAVAGTLAVLMLARIARRLFRSTLLGCLAGLLLALDGLEFVQSRTSMLDIFLMFWVLAAFGCLLVDRDHAREQLAAGPAGRVPSGPGPHLRVRWWRLATGACLGAACATKWSGLYDLAAFVVLAFCWDVGARRALGVSRPLRAAFRRDAPVLLGSVVLLSAAVYTLAWSGWFLGSGRTAYDHDAYVRSGQSTVAHAVAVAHGWLQYQGAIWHFGDTLNTRHPYQSHPIGWLLLARPVSYFYTGPKTGEAGCTATANCAREVLAIGTPAIWWPAIGALVATLWVWVARRDWRAGAILLGVGANILPWAWYDLHGRTEFFFYALPALPFLILALTMSAGLVLGPWGVAPTRQALGAALVGGYAVTVIISFFYFYPILSAQLLPYPSWHLRMWFGSWI
jgi:dolichyl-phosphate-mannose-protein mannosyltransferase